MLDEKQWQLLRRLGGGELVSGEALGQLLGVSRTAVWKHLKKLESHGLAIESVKGHGYRLREPMEWLSDTAITAELTPEAATHLSALSVLGTTASTSQALLAMDGDFSGRVCVAEHQTAGRGRRGRPWVSPLGRNLYCSVGWEFAAGAAALEGLSLAVGVMLCEALVELGVEGAALKWPNDVLHDERKLAGVLLEMTGDPAGQCRVVVGVGVNVGMDSSGAAAIDQPWTDVHTALGAPVSRNRLLAALLNRLLPGLARFAEAGFAPWQAAWAERDACRDRDVRLLLGDRVVRGRSLGVDARGAIRVRTAAGEQVYNGGEISLRPA